MKTIFRFLTTGALTAAILALSAVAGFGQEACADVDGQNDLYGKFTANFQKKTSAELRIAADAAKGFLEKYGACESVKEQADYMRPWVPKLEENIKKIDEGAVMKALFTRFDSAINTDNAAELYASGKDILGKQPDNYNIIVPLGVVGWYQAAKNNNAHADDALRFAKMALEDIKSGKAKATKKNKDGQEVWGALKYEFTKDAAISELTYAVGYLNYYVKKDKKAALPYYYELAQAGRYKDEPRIYSTIGNYYVDELAPIVDEVPKLVEKLKTAADDAAKADLEAQIKAKIAMFNGYAERAMDALGRAHAKATKPADKTLKDSLYKQLQAIYERRFEKKDGMDTYLATTIAKPMPNPTTPVTPVSDPEPTTTTTTSTSTAAPAPAKPAAATTTTKPMSTMPTKSVAKKGTRN